MALAWGLPLHCLQPLPHNYWSTMECSSEYFYLFIVFILPLYLKDTLWVQNWDLWTNAGNKSKLNICCRSIFQYQHNFYIIAYAYKSLVSSVPLNAQTWQIVTLKISVLFMYVCTQVYLSWLSVHSFLVALHLLCWCDNNGQYRTTTCTCKYTRHRELASSHPLCISIYLSCSVFSQFWYTHMVYVYVSVWV